MKKYEVEYLITLCENFPKVMSGIVIKNEDCKKEILDMVADCNCEFKNDEIIFKNGSIISIIKPKRQESKD